MVKADRHLRCLYSSPSQTRVSCSRWFIRGKDSVPFPEKEVGVLLLVSVRAALGMRFVQPELLCTEVFCLLVLVVLLHKSVIALC